MDSNHRPHAYQACALTSWAIDPYGGDKEIRTLDPLRARQVLSQLSYTPIWWTIRDSNPRPTGYEPVALTNWANDPFLPGNILLSHTVSRAVPSAL